MRGQGPGKQKTGRRGSVLIMTLVVTVVLSALALSVAALVSNRMAIARDRRLQVVVRRDMINAAYASAAVVLADTNGWDAAGERWCGVERARSGADAETHLHVAPPKVTEPEDWIALQDEQSKININTAGEALLAVLLEQGAGLKGAEHTICLHSLLDWRDADDETRDAGAEEAFYMRAKRRHGCANAPMGSLDELLLVRGGAVPVLDSVRPFVTVHGSGRLNLNTAPLKVLTWVALASDQPSAAERVVAKIVSARESGARFERADVPTVAAKIRKWGVLSSEESVVLSRMMPIFCVESDCFRGVVTAGRGNDRDQVRGSLEFVVSRRAGGFVSWLVR